MSLTKVGDWQRAGAVLKALNSYLVPAFKGRLYEDSQVVLEALRGHIDRQDLPWIPLSQKTVELKGGDETIYVESGYLRDNIDVRKIKSSQKDVTYFIGASAWKKHPSGVKFSDIMIWLEYGTDKIPPRPLIIPTVDEMENQIRSGWYDFLKDYIGGIK